MAAVTTMLLFTLIFLYLTGMALVYLFSVYIFRLDIVINKTVTGIVAGILWPYLLYRGIRDGNIVF